MDSERSEVISATVRTDHLARFDQLAAKRRVERSTLVAKAIDGLLAWHDLAGGYIGPQNDLPIEGFATEVTTACVRADHPTRFDELAARRGVSRSELVGQAIDSMLAKEAMIGAIGTPETAAPGREIRPLSTGLTELRVDRSGPASPEPSPSASASPSGPIVDTITVGTALAQRPAQVRQVGGAHTAHPEIDDAYRVLPGKGG